MKFELRPPLGQYLRTEEGLFMVTDVMGEWAEIMTVAPSWKFWTDRKVRFVKVSDLPEPAGWTEPEPTRLWLAQSLGLGGAVFAGLWLLFG